MCICTYIYIYILYILYIYIEREYMCVCVHTYIYIYICIYIYVYIYIILVSYVFICSPPGRWPGRARRRPPASWTQRAGRSSSSAHYLYYYCLLLSLLLWLLVWLVLSVLLLLLFILFNTLVWFTLICPEGWQILVRRLPPEGEFLIVILVIVLTGCMRYDRTTSIRYLEPGGLADPRQAPPPRGVITYSNTSHRINRISDI